MAENKNFYQFKVKIDEKTRDRRRKVNKTNIPLSEMLQNFGLSSEKDVVKQEENLRPLLNKELLLMNKAIKSENFSIASNYALGKDEKGNEIRGGIQDVKDYFSALDNFDKNHQDDHFDYCRQLTQIEEKGFTDEYTQADKEREIRELELKYADAIEALERCIQTEEKAVNWSQDIQALSDTPSKVLINLLKFHNQCQDSGKIDEFNRVYQDFISQREGTFAPREDKDGNIINEHRFNLDKDGHVCHSVLNLQNSGLDITIIDNTIGLAHCTQNLTQEQIKALAEYCFFNGIEIDDALKLKDLKVIDEKGKELGTAAEQLAQETDMLATRELEASPSSQGLDVSDEDLSNLEPVIEPLDAIDEPPYNGPFSQFLPDTAEVNPNISKMEKACKVAIGKMGFFPEGGCTNIKRGWNSTIISVYANENDRLDDGQVDKDGHRKHTKQFAVKLIASRPPRAQLYMDPNKKFEADHARLALDSLKAIGCKYFIIPPIDKSGGKQVQGAFMKASIKTMMVPYLKDSKNGKGCNIGAPDLESILEELPKESGATPKQKTEYLMRLSDQLDKYMSWNKDASLNTSAGKVKQQARFQMFSADYLEKLQDHIQDGVDGKLEGKQWDSVDQVTAIAAMDKIIRDIEAGKLNGKLYNPLGDNEELLKNTLDQYMKAERPKVESLVADNMQKLSKSGETENAKTKSAVNGVRSAYEKALNKTLTHMKGFGVDLRPEIVPAKVDYYIDKGNQANNNINNSRVNNPRDNTPRDRDNNQRGNNTGNNKPINIGRGFSR